jgi:transcriptional regulator with XRE-family HTH domain
MDLTFGARLRQQREQQHVTLAAISAATKIKRSLLEELESDTVAHWPCGLYRRAYLRDYARAVGLDPEAVVKEFQELYPDPSMTPEPGADGETNGDAPPQPETRFRRLFSAVLGSPWAQRDPVAERLEATRALMARDALLTDGVAAPGATFEHFAEADDRPDVLPDEDFGPILECASAVSSISIATVADLCTRLAQAGDSEDIEPVLADTAELFDAVGTIVWAWDASRAILTPVLAHGYDSALLARLRGVRRDAANAIATAFRSSKPCVVPGSGDATGALVVPMMGPGGCAGVVAFELQDAAEQDESVVAAARLIAAQLATLVAAPMAEAAGV